MSKGTAGGTTTLSADQVKELLAGEGMGLAKPAELNHYPGPKHVLELVTELALTADQLRRVEVIRGDMLAAARRLGAAIVEVTKHLHALRVEGHVLDVVLAGPVEQFLVLALDHRHQRVG